MLLQQRRLGPQEPADEGSADVGDSAAVDRGRLVVSSNHAAERVLAGAVIEKETVTSAGSSQSPWRRTVSRPP